MSIPTWLQNKSVVILETVNGYAVAPNADAKITECVAFETFAALTYYLEVNFAPRDPA